MENFNSQTPQFLRSQITQTLQFLNSSDPNSQLPNPQIPKSPNPNSPYFIGCLFIVENFLKKNRQKWWKVGKNALILQVEKMI